MLFIALSRNKKKNETVGKLVSMFQNPLNNRQLEVRVNPLTLHDVTQKYNKTAQYIHSSSPSFNATCHIDS